VATQGERIGVLVPSWSSGGRGSRLQIQLRAKQPQQHRGGGIGSGIFTLQSIVEFDWKVAVGDGSIVLTKEEFLRLVSLKQPLVSVRGQWVELRQGDIKSALEMLRSYRSAGGIPAREVIELAAAGLAKGTVEVKVTEADGWLKGVMQQLTSSESQQELQAPAGFSGVLRPYQARGFSWLAFMRRLGLGACLADDMGLGKTIQFIALMLHNASTARDSRNGRGGTLLVCPTSIVGNWKREVERFAPSKRVMVHHGQDRRRGDGFVRAAEAHDLVITSYSLMTRDAEVLSAVDWDTVALDEAQNIKNHRTKQSQAARRLKAKQRIALTGTPIENRLSELWSIMDFLNPGYLGSLLEFRRGYAIPIERYGDIGTQQRLSRIAQPFILRRLKTDPGVIDDLPEKSEAKVYCNLTDEQASLYDAYVKEMLSKIDSSEGIERRGMVLAALTRLKQICDHPSLFLADNSNNLQGRSGKMERLREMLEEVISMGEKALVFTQYAAMGEMLRRHLQASLGCETLFLHGGVSRNARDEMVARFQSGDAVAGLPPIFILSLRAGGLGLNLTRANHVFHFDRWWNPAVENQATDRAHRIGQTRNVQVHKLISGGTLEDRIDTMIEHKKGLAEDIIGTGEAWLTELSTKELRDVFTLRREDSGAG
jgi:SNF2 family DNA or RNA helicase